VYQALTLKEKLNDIHTTMQSIQQKTLKPNSLTKKAKPQKKPAHLQTHIARTYLIILVRLRLDIRSDFAKVTPTVRSRSHNVNAEHNDENADNCTADDQRRHREALVLTRWDLAFKWKAVLKHKACTYKQAEHSLLAGKKTSHTTSKIPSYRTRPQ